MTTTKRTKGKRLGWIGYIEILNHLKHNPSTAMQLESRFSIGATHGSKVARHLRAVRLIHVTRWHQDDQPRAMWRPVWAFGHHPDAPRPGNGKRSWSRASNLSSNLVALASVVRALVEPITFADLVQTTGCGSTALRALLRYARSKDFARIADWCPVASLGGSPAPMWCLGSRADAPRPKAKTRKEICAQGWARRRGRLAMQAMIAATGPAGYAGAAA